MPSGLFRTCIGYGAGQHLRPGAALGFRGQAHRHPPILFKLKTSRYTKNKVLFSVSCVYVREDVREDGFSLGLLDLYSFVSLSFPVHVSIFPVRLSPSFRFGFPFDYPAAVPGRFFPGFSRKRS